MTDFQSMIDANGATWPDRALPQHTIGRTFHTIGLTFADVATQPAATPAPTDLPADEPTPLNATPDEWALADYDHRRLLGRYHGHNHIRPMFQILEDARSSTPEAPHMSGEARWPTPLTYSDLDWLEARDSGQTFLDRTRRRTA